MRNHRKTNSFLFKKCPHSGFTLLEVLIALSVFAIGILGVASMQVSSSSGNTRARKLTEASELTQAQLENLQTVSFATLDNMSVGQVISASSVGQVSGVTSSGTYSIQYQLMSENDFNSDGANDMLVVDGIVTHPTGETIRYTFAKFSLTRY